MVLGVSRSSLERLLACPYSFVAQTDPALAHLRPARRPSPAARRAARAGRLVERGVAEALASGGSPRGLASREPGLAERMAAAVERLAGGASRVYRAATAWIPGYGGYGVPDVVVEACDGRFWVVEVKASRASGWRLRLQLEWYLYSGLRGGLWVYEGEWRRVEPRWFAGVILVASRGGPVRVETLRAGEEQPRLVTDENLAALIVAKMLARDHVAYDTGVRLKDCRRCPYKHVCGLLRERGLVETRRLELPAPPVGAAWARELTDVDGLEPHEVAAVPHGGLGARAERIAEAVRESMERPRGPLLDSLEAYGYARGAARLLWERVSAAHLAP